MDIKDRVASIRNQHRALADLAANLRQTILDNDAKEYFLKFATNSLSDVETFLLPHALKAQTEGGNAGIYLQGAEMMLNLAAGQLKQAQDAVNKYGPDLRVVGG